MGWRLHIVSLLLRFQHLPREVDYLKLIRYIHVSIASKISHRRLPIGRWKTVTVEATAPWPQPQRTVNFNQPQSQPQTEHSMQRAVKLTICGWRLLIGCENSHGRFNGYAASVSAIDEARHHAYDPWLQS